MKHKAMTLLEALITSVIIAIVSLSTIDLMGKMFISESVFNDDLNYKEYKTAVTEKIISTVMPGDYLYKANTQIIIPTKNSNMYVNIGTQSIAVLTPEFTSSGSLSMPSNTTTDFTGTAFSIISEADWNGGSATRYVLVETILNDESLNLAVDSNDTLKISAAPPTDWSQGQSFVLATNLKPGKFSSQTNAFYINSERSALQFAFVPMADGLYFPSVSSSIVINDSKFISSVNLRNWRETTY